VEYFDATDATGTPVKTWYLESDSSGHVKMDDSHITNRLDYTSDTFFMHKGKIVIPVGGYLQITEVAAPAEYVVTKNPVGIATTEDADLILTYENGKAWYDEYERCKVTIKKYEDDGVTPISGVEFELKFLEQTITPTSKKHPRFIRLLNVGESVVRSTNSNGEVFFDNLDQGIYQLTEIKTQPGRALLTEPVIVTLPMEMTNAEAAAYGNVDFSTAKEDKSYTDKWFFYSCVYEVTNNAVLQVPMTGSSGTWKLGLMGAGMFATIVTGWIIYDSMVRRKRRYKYRKRTIKKK
jgi:hypothetical protein